MRQDDLGGVPVEVAHGDESSRSLGAENLAQAIPEVGASAVGEREGQDLLVRSEGGDEVLGPVGQYLGFATSRRSGLSAGNKDAQYTQTVSGDRPPRANQGKLSVTQAPRRQGRSHPRRGMRARRERARRASVPSACLFLEDGGDVLESATLRLRQEAGNEQDGQNRKHGE